MICQPCRDHTHADCIDVYQGPDTEDGRRAPLVLEFEGGITVPDDWHLPPGRRYRSCDCLHMVLAHKVRQFRRRLPQDVDDDQLIAVGPATGPAGE